MAPNHLHYFSCWAGTALTGAASTTINPAYQLHEVLHQLKLTKAKVLVTHPDCLTVAFEAAAALKIPVMIMDEPSDATASAATTTACPAVIPSAPAATATALNVPVLYLSDALLHPVTVSDPASFAAPADSFDDQSLVTIPFSSGTTGQSKGVMLSHSNITKNVLQIHQYEGKYLLPEHTRSGERGVLICPLPFYHIYGMVAGMLMPAVTGAKLVMMKAFDLKLFLGLIDEHKVTRGHVVPPIVLGLAKHPMIDEFSLQSLETLMSGAAPLGAEVGT